MWNEPSADDLALLPKVGPASQIAPRDRIIRMHFYGRGNRWFAVEYDANERLFFGFVIRDYNFSNGSWTVFHFDELLALKLLHGFEVNRELNWRPRQALEIELIVEADNIP